MEELVVETPHSQFSKFKIVIAVLVVLGLAIVAWASWRYMVIQNADKLLSSQPLIVAVTGNNQLTELAVHGQDIQRQASELSSVASMRLRSGIVRSTIIDLDQSALDNGALMQLDQAQLFETQYQLVVSGKTIIPTAVPGDVLADKVLNTLVEINGQQKSISEVSTVKEEVYYGNQIHWLGYWDRSANEFVRQKALYYEVQLKDGISLEDAIAELEDLLNRQRQQGSGVDYQIVQKPRRLDLTDAVTRIFNNKLSVSPRQLLIYIPVGEQLSERELITESAALDEILKRYLNVIDHYYYRYDGIAHGRTQPFTVILSLIDDPEQLSKPEDVADGLQAELVRVFGEKSKVTVAN